MKRNLGCNLIDHLVSRRDFLMGEFSAADCAAYPFLKHAHREMEGTSILHSVLHDFMGMLDAHPRLLGWVERMQGYPRG